MRPLPNKLQPIGKQAKLIQIINDLIDHVRSITPAQGNGVTRTTIGMIIKQPPKQTESKPVWL